MREFGPLCLGLPIARRSCTLCASVVLWWVCIASLFSSVKVDRRIARVIGFGPTSTFWASPTILRRLIGVVFFRLAHDSIKVPSAVKCPSLVPSLLP